MLRICKYSTYFKAEAQALHKAATAVLQNSARTAGQAVLFTDALSLLQALKNCRNKELNPLCNALATLSATVQEAVRQWIPAHCGIRDNEKADTLAKERAQKDKTERLVSFDEAKTIIKTQQRRTWQLEHPCHNPNGSYIYCEEGSR